jgi:hypothetical protein
MLCFTSTIKGDSMTKCDSCRCFTNNSPDPTFSKRIKLSEHERVLNELGKARSKISRLKQTLVCTVIALIITTVLRGMM